MGAERGIERRFLTGAHARRRALERFAYGAAVGPASLARGALTPLSALWARVAALRSAAAHAARVGLDQPVLSVGGLGPGGSGKTPFVRWLGRRLAEAGRSPAVLTRGYGWVRRSDPPCVLLPRATSGAWQEPGGERTEASGGSLAPDEALLLVADGLPVAAHPDRARAAAALAGAGLHPDAYLLDDGFQHRRLHRDWDLVVLSRRDLAAPRLPFPAGPFREGWSALRRAGRIAITGLTAGEARELAGRSGAQLGLPPGKAPVLAGLAWDGLVELEAWRAGLGGGAAGAAGRQSEAAEAPERPLLAFSGIADPASFERLLASRRLPVAVHVVFPDHHRYSAEELARLLDMLPPGGALVTTEKDAARLAPGALPRGACRLLRVQLVVWSGEEVVRADLRRLVPGDA